ncbi:hypothetical protein D9757_002894 [Collybiopsis confluens]|uniref:Uncharacterized protein n=1 Tax=Collybiopsis confluens TaxID=2823264 RepID=A0A8H5HV66_9AGAR|nr:hypothetical protein D9757_002894 [Collybiopsis confluens]
MIAGLSKAVTLYLAPLLSLTAILLSLFAYLSPVVLLSDRVALLTVLPSTALTQANGPKVDGVSMFLGALGSCSRPDNAADINCTTPSLSPVYDLSDLPSNAPQLTLSAPPSSSPAFIAVSLVISILFFFTFTMISLRHKMGEKLAGAMDKPAIQRISAWLGFFGFFIGLTTFLILRMLMGKSVDDFNNAIISMGSGGPQLVAATGNGFIMIWVAYAFYAVPVIASLTKINVTQTKA